MILPAIRSSCLNPASLTPASTRTEERRCRGGTHPGERPVTAPLAVRLRSPGREAISAGGRVHKSIRSRDSLVPVRLMVSAGGGPGYLDRRQRCLEAGTDLLAAAD